jgi:hypothetical protein
MASNLEERLCLSVKKDLAGYIYDVSNETWREKSEVEELAGLTGSRAFFLAAGRDFGSGESDPDAVSASSSALRFEAVRLGGIVAFTGSWENLRGRLSSR